MAIRHVCILTLVSVIGWAALGCFGGDKSGVELPELTPFDEDLAAQLYAIAVEASSVRGLEGNDRIEQGTLSQEQLTDYYRRAATEARLQDEHNYKALNTAFRLLHMIGPDDDLLEFAEAGAADILGFYAFEGDQLVLISDTPAQLTLDDEATLAHEFVHSFQDKRFDLGKLLEKGEKEERKKANTEYADTLDALIEGDAMVSQFQYVEGKVGPDGLRDWLTSVGEEGGGEESDGTALPAAIERYGSFPYTYGSAFVRYLYDEGGWEAVNEAYEDPPKTEEQILHPEKYERNEEPVGLSLRDLSKDLGEGWKQEMDSVFGEFDVYNWLRSTLENEFQAQSAGAGWGGGRVAVYAKPEEPASVLVHVALVWDNADEAREFFTTFQDVVRLIDPKPVPLDPSGQIIAWQGEDEMGQAWIDWTSFQMVVGVAQDDLAAALEAIDAPTKIPESGHLLKSRPSGPTTRPQIRRLEGVLLEVGDLPPGFVLVQSGDTELQNPVVSQGVEQRFAVFADVRSEGDGVVSVVSRVPGALPAGASWSWLAEEDPRLIFESLVAQLLLAGDVREFSRLPLEGIGEGVVAARGVVTPMGGSPQVVKVVVFGRGATLAIVVTFQDTSSRGMDAGQLARIVDERLRRYTP